MALPRPCVTGGMALGGDHATAQGSAWQDGAMVVDSQVTGPPSDDAPAGPLGTTEPDGTPTLVARLRSLLESRPSFLRVCLWIPRERAADPCAALSRSAEAPGSRTVVAAANG